MGSYFIGAEAVTLKADEKDGGSSAISNSFSCGFKKLLVLPTSYSQFDSFL